MQSKLAVFWDIENIKPKLIRGEYSTWIDNLLSYLGLIGEVRYFTVYGKLNLINQQILEKLIEYKIKLVNVGSVKNSADIVITVDSLTLLYEDGINDFVIISSDQDFLPLIGKIRDRGCRVILIGDKESTEKLIDSTDIFIPAVQIQNFNSSVESLSTTERKAVLKSSGKTISLNDAKLCLQMAIYQLNNTNGVVYQDELDIQMRKLSQFSYFGYKSIIAPRGINFSSFGKFLEFIQNEGEINLEDNAGKIKVNTAAREYSNSIEFDKAVMILLDAIKSLKSRSKMAILSQVAIEMRALTGGYYMYAQQIIIDGKACQKFSTFIDKAIVKDYIKIQDGLLEIVNKVMENE